MFIASLYYIMTIIKFYFYFFNSCYVVYHLSEFQNLCCITEEWWDMGERQNE